MPEDIGEGHLCVSEQTDTSSEREVKDTNLLV